MSIEWREDLATGNVEIDNQHKELFKRFNTLLAACNAGKARNEVGNLLNFLGDYVKSHFATEERLQVKHGYPGYAAHKQQHTEFISDLRNLEQQIATEGAGVSLVIQTNQMIVNWLIGHISKTDKALADFLKTVG